MNKKITIFLILAAIIVSPSFVQATKRYGNDCASCHILSNKEASDLLLPLNVRVQSIKHAPVQGMFEVLVKRADQQGVIYIDYAKKTYYAGSSR